VRWEAQRHAAFFAQLRGYYVAAAVTASRFENPAAEDHGSYNAERT
jgi:hypothetical protein